MSEQNGEKSIRLEQNVNANIQDVWNAWTTEEGVKSFFAPACNIDLKVGGAYEMLFDLKAEPGLQGGEGLTIMVLQPLAHQTAPLITYILPLGRALLNRKGSDFEPVNIV